jgi:hypothetical protein
MAVGLELARAHGRGLNRNEIGLFLKKVRRAS